MVSSFLVEHGLAMAGWCDYQISCYFVRINFPNEVCLSRYCVPLWLISISFLPANNCLLVIRNTPPDTGTALPWAACPLEGRAWDLFAVSNSFDLSTLQ
jgi:hypothetical protein